ncbi:retrotransposon protein, putative, ty1-copia subclass [Tanacetum coccineum]
MVPTKTVEKTPYEVWHGQAPKLSYLKVWGCEALVKRDTLTKLDKLEARIVPYNSRSKWEVQKDLKLSRRNTQLPIDTSLHHKEDDLEIDEPQSDIIPIRRSTRTRHAPDQNHWQQCGLFKKKTDMDGVVHTYKARLVAKGYTQPKIDYEETFSLVAEIRSIGFLKRIHRFYDYDICKWMSNTTYAHMNIFLKGLHGAT